MSINLTAFRNPLSPERETWRVEHGKTYRELLDTLGRGQNALIFCDDFRVLPEAWDDAPKDGALVMIRMVPGNEAGGAYIVKAIWFPILLVAGIIPNLWGDNRLWSLGLQFLVDVVHETQAFFGGKKSQGANTSLPGLKGASNSLDPWGTIPVIIGRHLITPKYAGLPYTEISTGDDGASQYIHLCFYVGYGPLSITDIKLGENSFASNPGGAMGSPVIDGATFGSLAWSSDTAYQVGQRVLSGTTQYKCVKYGTNHVPPNATYWVADPIFEVELRCDALPMTHYPLRVTESQFQMLMRSPPGGPTYLTQTTAPGCSRLEVDFECPDGLTKYNKDGNEDGADLAWKAEYRVAGTANAWVQFCDAVFLNKKLNQTGRWSFSHTPAGGATDPIGGQFEVRVYRLTPDSAATDAAAKSSTRDTVYWTALRTTINEPPVDAKCSSNMVRMSMRVKAGDTSNGSIASVNMIAQSLIPVFTGTGGQTGAAYWATVGATSNPAAQALYLLRGDPSVQVAGVSRGPNPRPATDALIDWAAFEGLYTWAADHASGGTHYASPCNGILDSQATLRESIGKILSAGRASLSMRGPVYSLVHDVAKPTPSQLFTPRNSWDFTGAKSFADLPHGLRVAFVNAAAGYQADECMVLADGYVYDIDGDTLTEDFAGAHHNTGDTYGSTVYELATKFESIQRWGLTDYSETHREGRYLLAARYLRPEVYSISADFESLACTRGDLVKFAHDVPLFGVIGGRVKSATGAGFAGDEVLTMAALKTYGIRYRLSDGRILFATLDTVVGSSYSATFHPTVAAGDVPQPDDLFWFGESGSETIDAIVVGIEPLDDLAATIYLQDYSPGIFTADSGTIPAFVSRISAPVAQDLARAGVDRSDASRGVEAAAVAATSAALALVRITCATPVVYQLVDGSYNPTSLTFAAEDYAGASYAGRWIIYRGGAEIYSPATDRASVTVDSVQLASDTFPGSDYIPGGSGSMTAEFYAAGGTVTLLDTFHTTTHIDSEYTVAAATALASDDATTKATAATALALARVPGYLGKFDTAPSSPDAGDWYLRYSASAGMSNRGVFLWSGTAWTRIDTTAYPALIAAAMPDILALSATYGVPSDYVDVTYIANIASITAFITNLFTTAVKLNTPNGILYAGAGHKGNDDTPVYIGADGYFSLRDKLIFDTGGNLKIKANIESFSSVFKNDMQMAGVDVYKQDITDIPIDLTGGGSTAASVAAAIDDYITSYGVQIRGTSSWANDKRVYLNMISTNSANDSVVADGISIGQYINRRTTGAIVSYEVGSTQPQISDVVRTIINNGAFVVTGGLSSMLSINLRGLGTTVYNGLYVAGAIKTRNGIRRGKLGLLGSHDPSIPFVTCNDVYMLVSSLFKSGLAYDYGYGIDSWYEDGGGDIYPGFWIMDTDTVVHLHVFNGTAPTFSSGDMGATDKRYIYI